MKDLNVWEREELEEIFLKLVNEGEVKYHDSERYILVVVPGKFSNLMNYPPNFLTGIELIEEFVDAHFVQALPMNQLLFRKQIYLVNGK